MRVHIAAALLLAICAIFFKGGGESKRSRKHYGLSYHSGCKDYIQTFTCMTACKSIGYQIFRLDFRCKCTCHELKTTTILPFFKWRTNGTTRAWIKTSSPSLYHIYGTLSPATYSTTENLTTLAETTENPCETPKPGNDTSDSNVTSNPGNDTSDSNVTSNPGNDTSDSNVKSNPGNDTSDSDIPSNPDNTDTTSGDVSLDTINTGPISSTQSNENPPNEPEG